MALIGRFGIAASFNMIFLYTTELFPTVVRSAALGTCSLVARIGGIAAPQVSDKLHCSKNRCTHSQHTTGTNSILPLTQIILFRRFHDSLPSLIFGATAAAACLTATLLPETKGVVLEDDLEGAAKQASAKSSTREFVRFGLSSEYNNDDDDNNNEEDEEILPR